MHLLMWILWQINLGSHWVRLDSFQHFNQESLRVQLKVSNSILFQFRKRGRSDHLQLHRNTYALCNQLLEKYKYEYSKCFMFPVHSAWPVSTHNSSQKLWLMLALMPRFITPMNVIESFHVLWKFPALLTYSSFVEPV